MKYWFIFLLILSSPVLVGQKLNSIQKSFLNKYGQEIKTENKTDKLVWDPLDQSLEGKTIVALGEFCHGSREIFLYRNDLIKYLHEKKHFDVILFESGLGEMAAVNQNLENLEGEKLCSGFFGGWRTSEFQELMEYAKKEGMSIGGFDIQRTGGGFQNLYRVAGSQYGLNTSNLIDLENRYGQLKGKLSDYSVEYPEVKEEGENLIKAYQSLSKNIVQNEDPMLLLILRTIDNRIGYLNYMLRFKLEDDWNARWKDRDSLMAANVVWLRENIFKGKRVILVAHNYHIAKDNPREEVMGEFLLEKYRRYFYSMGAFAGEGQYLDSRGNQKIMEPPSEEALDIKHVIQELDQDLSFIEIKDKEYRGGEWLEEDIIVQDSFIDLHNSKTLVLSKQFDGILLIRKSSTPKK